MIGRESTEEEWKILKCCNYISREGPHIKSPHRSNFEFEPLHPLPSSHNKRSMLTKIQSFSLPPLPKNKIKNKKIKRTEKTLFMHFSTKRLLLPLSARAAAVIRWRPLSGFDSLWHVLSWRSIGSPDLVKSCSLLMHVPLSNQLSEMDTTCVSLLDELQIIWEEIGEPDEERDKMLLEIERECLEVYKRKVDYANSLRAQLQRAITDSEAELDAICSALGEASLHHRKSVGSLREELNGIIPQLEEMRKKKKDRWNDFLEATGRIKEISLEIESTCHITVDESNLSIKMLEELQKKLQMLQQEKNVRSNHVLNHLHIINSLCLVLGMDFQVVVGEVHPSLVDSEEPKSITIDTIERLSAIALKLRETKIQRMQQLQDLASRMLELWDLMDTPSEEQQPFQNVTCNIAASEDEMTAPDSLSETIINLVEAEASRLEEVKQSRMKDLILKKRLELEELCKRTHVTEPDNETGVSVEVLESGIIDPWTLLEQIEGQIANVKEEAFNRREILEKIEKWMAACDEECWLEEYNKDENRYSAGRGAHISLKRAEKVRGIVNKIPAMVDTLVAKTTAWEKERGIKFMYDDIWLLSMLEEYNFLKKEREQERRRQRDEKRLQGQLMAEQEAVLGSKASPSKPESAMKLPRMSLGGPSGVGSNHGRRLSLGGAVLHPQKQEQLKSTKAIRGNKKADGVATLPCGRKGPEVGSLPPRKVSSNASNMQRIPFASITETVIIATPSKSKHASVDEENRDPQIMSVPNTKTPKAVSIPMQMPRNPAPAFCL